MYRQKQPEEGISVCVLTCVPSNPTVTHMFLVLATPPLLSPKLEWTLGFALVELARSAETAPDTDDGSLVAVDAVMAAGVAAAAPLKDGSALPVELGDVDSGSGHCSCSTGTGTSSSREGIGGGGGGGSSKVANHTGPPCGSGGINSLFAAAAAAVSSNWKALLEAVK